MSVDAVIGGNIRKRRRSLDRSQASVGHELGVTYQQMQKYESGRNRIAASTLWRLSEVLSCPVQDFYLGL